MSPKKSIDKVIADVAIGLTDVVGRSMQEPLSEDNKMELKRLLIVLQAALDLNAPTPTLPPLVPPPATSYLTEQTAYPLGMFNDQVSHGPHQ